jgi:hypothetical protein
MGFELVGFLTPALQRPAFAAAVVVEAGGKRQIASAEPFNLFSKIK